MPQPPAKKKSGIVIPQQPRWHGQLAARLIWLLSKGMAQTLRFELCDPGNYFGCAAIPGKRSIFCTWHNRLAICLHIYDEFIRFHNPDRALAAMVSASRDGGMLARVLQLYGVQPVRGSSSRRGAQATLELVSLAEQGYDIALTPDGPRGPKYVMQEGPIALAQITGMRIVPVSWYYSTKLTAKSWDNFQIPLPFSKCVIAVGEPVQVPRECDDSERERLRQLLETRLREITRD